MQFFPVKNALLKGSPHICCSFYFSRGLRGTKRTKGQKKNKKLSLYYNGWMINIGPDVKLIQYFFFQNQDLPCERYSLILCDKICHWLAEGQWFSPSSFTSKTDCQDITEILLNVVLNTITIAQPLNLKKKTYGPHLGSLLKLEAHQMRLYRSHGKSWFWKKKYCINLTSGPMLIIHPL
jgi:hypothetical protein